MPPPKKNGTGHSGRLTLNYDSVGHKLSTAVVRVGLARVHNRGIETMEYDFLIKTQTDKSIFENVAEALESAGLKYNLSARLVTHTTETYNPDSGQRNAQLDEVLQANSELVTSFTVTFEESMQFTIQRNRNERTTACKFRPTVEQRQMDAVWKSKNWMPLILDLRTRLVAVDSQAYSETILGKELADHYTRRDEELEKLRSMVEKATENLAKHQKEVSKTIAENEKRHREQQAKRDAEKDREVTALKDELEQSQEHFAYQKSLFDDRHNVHVRRELRGEWHKRIESRFTDFKLTADTQKMRKPVSNAVMWGLGLSSLLVIASIVSIGIGAYTDNPNWYYVSVIKGAVGGVAFFSLLSYYLHWQNSWLEKHAKAEFSHLQMALDIDRASWVVEMALEWNKEGNQPVPGDLLARLTRNMFAADGDGEPRQRKSDDFLLTLLGASSKCEVGVAGNKVTLDRRGCKEIAKEVGKADDV